MSPAPRNDAAVALLAKAPVPGRVKTRLTPPLSPEEASHLARVCLEETLRRFPPRVRAPWTVFLEGEAEGSLREAIRAAGATLRPQGRGSLGARLARVFRSLRGSGARRVLAIGSDSPTLDPERLLEALEALRSHDVVVGPTEDGGYYLIGSRVASDLLFRDIPWGTGAVARATSERARAKGLTVANLRDWYDLDRPADLRRAAKDGIECPALQAAIAAFGVKLDSATTPS